MEQFICEHCGYEHEIRRPKYTCKYCDATFTYKKNHFKHETTNCKYMKEFIKNSVSNGIQDIKNEKKKQEENESQKKLIKKLKTIIMIQQNTITKMLKEITGGNLTT